jgi:hypothetical protein
MDKQTLSKIGGDMGGRTSVRTSSGSGRDTHLT